MEQTGAGTSWQEREQTEASKKYALTVM